MFAGRTVPFGALCAWLLACAPVSASAMTAPPPPDLPAGTRARIEQVWRDNPLVQGAEAELRAARERSRASARPVYNPALQLEAEDADVDRRTVGASLALDMSGKRRARVQQGLADVREREAAHALAMRDVALDWLKAWVALTLAREQVALGQRRLDLMRRFDALADNRMKVGDISRPERDLARLALGEAEVQQSELAAAEAAAAATWAALGDDPDSPLIPLPPGLPPPCASLEPLPSTARMEIVQAQAAQDRVDAAVAIADAARRPDPTVSITGGRVRSGSRSDRVVGISVSMPLPVLDTGRYAVSAARADADAAYASRHATTLRVEARLRQARATCAAMRTASAAFDAAQADALDERARVLDRLWQAGEITTSDYLLQLKQNIDTALSGTTLRHQTWQAWFDYLSASGRLAAWTGGASKDSTP